MRMSSHFGETLRAAPGDVDVVSHQLLLRAGYVRQLATGIFSYLPLGLRAMRKIERIIREEMDAIGGQEITMPVVHPAEIWQETGRCRHPRPRRPSPRRPVGAPPALPAAPAPGASFGDGCLRAGA